MKKINVLSLFGGIEVGRAAIDHLGWEIGKYYSSEIDEYCLKTSTKNYPDIVHIGDVREVWYLDGELHGQGPTYDFVHDRVDIDLLIGGSPCQDLSGAKIGGKGLEGEKSSLFYDYIRILKEVNPKYFLLENVASMKESDRNKMSALVGCEPIELDGKHWGASNRKRLYWTNIPGVEELKNRMGGGETIADILEDIPMDDPSWQIIPEKFLTGDGRVRIAEATKKGYAEAVPGNVVDLSHEKSRSRRGRVHTKKLLTLTASMAKGNIPYLIGIARDRKDERLRIPDDQDKLPTLRASMGTGGNNVPLLINADTLYWRPLTCIELERALTLPDNYTAGVSTTQRRKQIGNTWMLKKIISILSYAKF